MKTILIMVVLLLTLEVWAGAPLPKTETIGGVRREGIMWGVIKDGKMQVIWKGGSGWVDLVDLPDVVLQDRGLLAKVQAQRVERRAAAKAAAERGRVLDETVGRKVSGTVTQKLAGGFLMEIGGGRMIYVSGHPDVANVMMNKPIEFRVKGGLRKYQYTTASGHMVAVSHYVYGGEVDEDLSMRAAP